MTIDQQLTRDFSAIPDQRAAAIRRDMTERAYSFSVLGIGAAGGCYVVFGMLMGLIDYLYWLEFLSVGTQDIAMGIVFGTVAAITWTTLGFSIAFLASLLFMLLAFALVKTLSIKVPQAIQSATVGGFVGYWVYWCIGSIQLAYLRLDLLQLIQGPLLAMFFGQCGAILTTKLVLRRQIREQALAWGTTTAKVEARLAKLPDPWVVQFGIAQVAIGTVWLSLLLVLFRNLGPTFGWVFLVWFVVTLPMTWAISHGINMALSILDNLARCPVAER